MCCNYYCICGRHTDTRTTVTEWTMGDRDTRTTDTEWTMGGRDTSGDRHGNGHGYEHVSDTGTDTDPYG